MNRPTLSLPRGGDLASLKARRKEVRVAHETIYMQSQAILGRAEKSRRELNSAESAEFDQNSRRMDALMHEMNELTDRIDPLIQGLEPGAFGTANTVNSGRIGFEANRIFGAARPSPFDQRPETFWQELHSGRYSPELQGMRASTGMEESVPSDGGFAVPEQLSFGMLNNVARQSLILQRANVQPMTTLTRKIAGFDNLTHTSSGALGGLEAVWTEEGGTLAEDQPTLRQIQLTAHKLTLLVTATSELLADAGGLQSEIEAEMARSLAFKLDAAFLRGSGSGQPKGVLNDSALITQAKESGQAASTVVTANLVGMYSRLHPQSVGNSIWIVNSATLPQIMELTLGSGTAVSMLYDPRPAATDTSSAGTLLGRPVYLSEHASTLGTVGDVILADWSQYIIGMRRQLRVDVSQHVKFNTDELTTRAIMRVDGQGKWDSVLTPANGNTSSWCTTLATRA